MALNDGDKAECKEIAREIVKEVLVEHVKLCPHGQFLRIAKARIIGILIGVIVGTGGISGLTIYGLAKLLAGRV
ncbi:MAG TPA: hypothetical protein ENH94_04245 [Phycisphaerales bacterium]|nr:hypothetical protein [Phycisphaerales bacterium]